MALPVSVCVGLLTSSGHVEHGRHPLHPTVRLLTLWSVLPTAYL